MIKQVMHCIDVQFNYGVLYLPLFVLSNQNDACHDGMMMACVLRARAQSSQNASDTTNRVQHPKH